MYLPERVFQANYQNFWFFLAWPTILVIYSHSLLMPWETITNKACTMLIKHLLMHLMAIKTNELKYIH